MRTVIQRIKDVILILPRTGSRLRLPQPASPAVPETTPACLHMDLPAGPRIPAAWSVMDWNARQGMPSRWQTGAIGNSSIDFVTDSTTMKGCLPLLAVRRHGCRGNAADLDALQGQGKLLSPWTCSFKDILSVEFQCFAQNHLTQLRSESMARILTGSL